MDSEIEWRPAKEFCRTRSNCEREVRVFCTSDRVHVREFIDHEMHRNFRFAASDIPTLERAIACATVPQGRGSNANSIALQSGGFLSIAAAPGAVYLNLQFGTRPRRPLKLGLEEIAALKSAISYLQEQI
jgi:hypothetical protein